VINVRERVSEELLNAIYQPVIGSHLGQSNRDGSSVTSFENILDNYWKDRASIALHSLWAYDGVLASTGLSGAGSIYVIFAYIR